MITYKKKRISEDLSNEQTQNLLGRAMASAQDENDVRKRFQDSDMQFLDFLHRNADTFGITPEQINFLKDEEQNKKITLGQNPTPFLLIPALYSGDRQNSITNFSYTVRILERILVDDAVNKLIKYYQVEPDKEYQFNGKPQKPEDIIQATIKSIHPSDKDLVASTIIREYIGKMDQAFNDKEAQSKQKKDDWSKLTQDVEKLAARIYELNKNTREKERFEKANIDDIENLNQAAINAITDSDDRAPTKIMMPNDDNGEFTAKINRLLNDAQDKAEAENRPFNIGNLSAQSIINLWGNRQEQKPEEQKSKTREIAVKNDRVVDKDTLEPIEIYDKDGNRLSYGNILR